MIGVLVFPDFQLLDAAGPISVFEIGARFEIPYGPGVELVSPGPQRLALYELTRPDAPERLANRRDF